MFGLNSLLVMIPVTFLLERYQADSIWICLTSALAIIPLARLMAEATEALSDFLGPTAGGLLNASLGNAPEIIIGYFALKQGLIDMVKASITGSILGNLLCGVGLILLSRLPTDQDRSVHYDLDVFKVHCGMLVLATFGLIIPAVFDFSTSSEKEISLEISVVLFLMYLQTVASTFFSRGPIQGVDDELEILRLEDERLNSNQAGSPLTALLSLTFVTFLLALMSERMTDGLDPAAQKLGLSSVFVGVFLLALLGNVADLLNVVRFARKGKVDLAMGIMLGSSSQMALMVAPCLVFLGVLFGVEMNLLFSKYELLAVIMTVTAVSSFLSSGKVKPRVGFSFVALYGMLGIGFYYAPG